MAYSHHQQRPLRLSGQDAGYPVFELPDSREQQQHPAMTATFLPGRDDDYYMPEVISPAPQRLMPEVPENIQDSLQNLEIQADGSRRQHPQHGGRGPNMNNGYNNGYGQQPIDEPQFDRKYAAIQEPSFSPFPILQNPPPTVPPTDEDRLLQLDFEREQVLASNDPEAQLLWAQEALTFIEVALSEQERAAEIEGHGRPPTPDIEHQMKEDAMNVINFLADQEHPRADFIRGTWLEFGKFGMPLDKREAFRCYARSAEKGFARAEYRMGMQFENSNEPAKAIRHYQQGAAMGDSASNYRLGMMTLLGQHGQKQDYARGVNFIRRAANDADENAPQGAYVFGMLVARELPGITVPDAFLPADVNLARQMIERAAYLGFSRAQLKMGTAYELCQLGCDFDPALSLHYNVLASRRGEAEADMAISKWFLCGHDGIFEKNEALAFKYAQRAAAQQLPTAEFALGYFYEIGMYVKVDLASAQEWYAKAAQHGNKDASGRIDGISRSKTLSRKDHENMAVSKIRARHGSQRQKVNPVAERHRFQNTAPVIEEAVDMPDPRMPSVTSVYYEDAPPLPQNFNPPPRGSSAAPGGGPNSFVRPDLLNNQPGGMTNRPGTAVPYPTMGRPGSIGQPPIRPSSAAGYGANHGPHPAPGHRPRSITNIPPAGTYGNNQRPLSGGRNAPFMVAPGGQPPYGDNGYGQQPYPEEPFVQPGGGYGGPQMGGPRPGTAQPGGRPGPGGPPAPIRPGTAVGPGPRPNSGHADVGPGNIGFVAPPEAMKPLQPAKGGNKLQKLPPQAQGPNRPGTANSMNNPNRPPSARPNPQQQAPPPQQAPAQRPMTASPAQQNPTRPPPAPTPLPGKGPKTFAEMGVPETKKEDECCIM